MDVTNITVGYNLTELHTQQSDVIKKIYLFCDMGLVRTGIDGK